MQARNDSEVIKVYEKAGEKVGLGSRLVIAAVVVALVVVVALIAVAAVGIICNPTDARFSYCVGISVTRASGWESVYVGNRSADR
jgi:hypothetical protein